MKPACKNCYFWDRQYENVGHCRLEPPSPNRKGFGEWVKTKESDWCGSYYPEEELGDIGFAGSAGSGAGGDGRGLSALFKEGGHDPGHAGH